MGNHDIEKLSSFLLSAVYLGWMRMHNASLPGDEGLDNFDSDTLERYYQRAQIESMLRHLETNRSTLGGLISGKTLYAVNPLLYLFKEGNHSWILEFLSNNTDNTRPEEYYRNIAADSIFIRDRNELKEYFPIVVALMCTSLVLLLAVVLVYTTVAKLRTTHGKNVITLSVCFVVVYIGLLLDLVGRDLLSPAVCLSVSIVQHGMFLAVFFWTNVMAYDIWQAIGTLTPYRTHPTLRKDKYFSYSLYAWIMTLSMVLTAVLLDFTDLIEHWYRPHFGEGKCWLNGYLAYVLYFIMPVGLILTCNGVIFALTASSLHKAKTTTLVNIFQAAQHRRIFHLYMKLSLIMGIIWTLEFIPWLTGYHRLYVVVGLLNCLHGLYLFVIFLCKRRVWIAFRDTVPFLRTRRLPTLPPVREISKASLNALTSTTSLCVTLNIDATESDQA
ncbi:G-protein coupled receptor Mth-like isoform X2 [Varroa jacobsoni]|uniref:G-protein coupled receptors family 2 profile 2 domain-containing protein n=2 Tax=Varroa TaxID=62624 RepID=A0A7M7KB90_VARDE|nr:G-protein coupled receptor Mth-like [Varroa destructor]XP_022664300.1 G-protein coupled receptor Mth-like [Varroa destructor]XP_022664301.1 G-protein coupled receptor Mth-like [Varroa destructor]XP_022664302.1 G-protein coupled receptor Mth-like [Varroa destructor]XP_022664303.1 G-protein coupled receptor Mth-like [Varroa destructor]XP_022664304.1 G-protein coupled receptor Mth-like [Varroa destructor]XP_022691119.1 G-protein coupled receptor Mth-like isoform X2 [Varroa jacobsoni]XP_02269